MFSVFGHGYTQHAGPTGRGMHDVQDNMYNIGQEEVLRGF